MICDSVQANFNLTFMSFKDLLQQKILIMKRLKKRKKKRLLKCYITDRYAIGNILFTREPYLSEILKSMIKLLFMHVYR